MIREHGRAVSEARRLISEYGIRDPKDIDLEAIAFDMRVFVRQAPLKGSAARLLRKGDGGIIRVDATIASEGQRRFCVAHELGHLVLHPELNQLALCSSQDMLPWYQRSREEPEANSFAAELLMPEEIFRERCPQSEMTLAVLEHLAAEFRTTMTATAYRYIELGIHVSAMAVSEKGTIRWSLPGPDFPFKLRESRSTVDGRSCAGEFFHRGRAGKIEEDVPASAWLDDQRVEETWMIREMLIPMPSYASSLSVLWVVPRSPLDRM